MRVRVEMDDSIVWFSRIPNFPVTALLVLLFSHDTAYYCCEVLNFVQCIYVLYLKSCVRIPESWVEMRHRRMQSGKAFVMLKNLFYFQCLL